MLWEDEIKKYLIKLDKIKPVIYCGDLNVAHEEIDLKNPKTNRKSAGYTDEDRQRMTAVLQLGLRDTIRYLYPEKENAYSWWSYMSNAREKNVGWRIDYFIVSKSIEIQIQDSMIYSAVL